MHVCSLDFNWWLRQCSCCCWPHCCCWRHSGYWILFGCQDIPAVAVFVIFVLSLLLLLALMLLLLLLATLESSLYSCWCFSSSAVIVADDLLFVGRSYWHGVHAVADVPDVAGISAVVGITAECLFTSLLVVILFYCIVNMCINFLSNKFPSWDAILKINSEYFKLYLSLYSV